MAHFVSALLDTEDSAQSHRACIKTSNRIGSLSKFPFISADFAAFLVSNAFRNKIIVATSVVREDSCAVFLFPSLYLYAC